MSTTTTPLVYKAINAVQAAMAKDGIAKTSQNKQQGYAFRGIDSVYAALAPHLAAQKLCILPRVIANDTVERASKSGGVLFYTTLRVEFDFVAVEDGTKHTVCTIGEAMDSGDKSSNKAMSAAYKYACFLAFAIPTEGDNDADAVTHEPAPKEAAPYKPSGPMVSGEIVAQLNELCCDAATATRLDHALTKKGVVAFTDLSETDARKLLEWARTNPKK